MLELLLVPCKPISSNERQPLQHSFKGEFSHAGKNSGFQGWLKTLCPRLTRKTEMGGWAGGLCTASHSGNGADWETSHAVLSVSPTLDIEQSDMEGVEVKKMLPSLYNFIEGNNSQQGWEIISDLYVL